jgi:hypothetical protein
VAGVVLHVAQGGADVQTADRLMAQRVRRELLPCADPGRASQVAHQLTQVALAEPNFRVVSNEVSVKGGAHAPERDERAASLTEGTSRS